MGILEKCKRGSSLSGLVQLTTKFTKDPRAGTKARVRAKTPQAGRERSGAAGRPASREREGERERRTERKRVLRGGSSAEERRAGDEAARDRDRYASETCRNAKRCRPGSGTTALLGKAPRHLRRPRNRRSARVSRVFIDDYYTHTYVARIVSVSQSIKVPKRHRGVSDVNFRSFDARGN